MNQQRTSLSFWLSSPQGICGSNLRRILLVAILAFIPKTAHPQGCTQCMDSTAAGTVFLSTLVILKRHR
jgi:hypothetical protein